MGLGSGANVAAIYDQNGRRPLFVMPAQTQVEWSRSIDAISEAHVTAVPPGVGSTGHNECCDLLGRIYPWLHTLVVFRDGVRVWEGPVTKVTASGTAVAVDALDVVGWLRRRPVAARLVESPASILDEAETLLASAFEEHDPNVMSYVQVIPHGETAYITRDVAAASTYAADDLDDLVGSGLRYTAVGRSIILWNHGWLLGTLEPLYPSRDLVDNVTFARDGMAMATREVARNDSGEIGFWPPNPADAVDLNYGLVSQIVEANTVTGSTALAVVAENTWTQAYPLPTVMQMPDGATLNCEASYDIQQLVPGVMMPVFEDGLCWSVRQQMMLSAVKVTQDQGGEAVAVTLVPLSGAQAAEGNSTGQGITLSVADSSGRIWTQQSDDGSTAVFTAEVPAIGPPGAAKTGAGSGTITWHGSASGHVPGGGSGLAVTLRDSGHDTTLNAATFTTPNAVTVTAGRLYVLHIHLTVASGTSPNPTVTGPGTLVEVARIDNSATRGITSLVYRCTAGGTGTWTWSNAVPANWNSTIWALEEWTGHDDAAPVPQSDGLASTSVGTPPSYTATLPGNVTAGSAITAAFQSKYAENGTVVGDGTELYDQTETAPVGSLTVVTDLAPVDNAVTVSWITAGNVRANIIEIAQG